MDRVLGTIIYTGETPNTTEFHMIVSEEIKKNQFVKFPVDGKTGIGMVTEIISVNKYFEKPDSLYQFEKKGVSINDYFPVDEWKYRIARVNILGAMNNDVIERLLTPPEPGTKILEIDNELLEKFLGFDDNGLEIGKIENHELPVKLNASRTFQKHLAILAQSGAGKSYLVSVFLEELLEKTNISCVLIDVHGEYLGFYEDEHYREKVRVFDNVKIPVSSLSAAEFSEYFPLSAPQKRELNRIINKLRERNEPYGIQELIEAVKEDERIKENTKIPLISWLEELENTNLFSKYASPSISELASPGMLSIIDLSKMVDLRKKQIIVHYLGKTLFNSRRNEKIPPVIFFVEEAHNFAREGSAETNISKGIIETIAREGRKFGIGLCLISQRPIHLSTTALSQCNSFIILRVTNPYDIDHIGKSCEALDSRSKAAITTLRTGEALILGEAVNFPVFVKVRQRKSKELSGSKPMEEMAKEFVEKSKQEEEDARAFM